VERLRRRLAEVEADTHATVSSRDSWQAAASAAEAKLAEHARAADGAVVSGQAAHAQTHTEARVHTNQPIVTRVCTRCSQPHMHRQRLHF
jgi:hypothetical protein